MAEPAAPPREGGHRLLEVDALRGVAAVAVVLFHLTTRFNELYLPSQPPSWQATHGHLGVNLFFIISGFVIFMTLDRTRRPMDFVVSRFSRLFPAYWCAIALTFTLTHWMGLPDKTVPLWAALANTLMLHGFFFVPHVDGVYWTLEVELLFYFGMFMLYRSGRLHRVLEAMLLLLGLRLVYVLLDRAFGVELSWTLSRLLILKYIPWFALGIAIYGLVHPSPRHTLRRCLWQVAAALLTLFIADSPFMAGLAVVLGLLVYGAASGRLPWLRHPVLVWFGSISYPLYLLHENIGWSIELQGIARGLSTDVSAVVAAVVAVLLAAALHVTVERPAMDWIRAQYRRRLEHQAARADSRAPTELR